MEKQLRALHLVMTLATLLVLALLAWQCIDIYLVGNSSENLDPSGVYRHPVYSVEIVRAHWEPIRPAVIGYICLTLGALILQALWTKASAHSPFATFSCGRSRNRKNSIFKGHLGKPKVKMETSHPRWMAVRIVQIGVYTAAALFILLGVMNGGLRDVLIKAANICTECIGLG